MACAARDAAIWSGRSRMADNVPVSKDRRRAKNRSRRLGLAMGGTLIAAAVATELRKPNAARTWEGRIAGRIPYDPRPPTLARAQARLWNGGFWSPPFSAWGGRSISDACSSRGRPNCPSRSG